MLKRLSLVKGKKKKEKKEEVANVSLLNKQLCWRLMKNKIPNILAKTSLITRASRVR